MKTLVIHPEDSTTDFLNQIYADKGFTVETRHKGRDYSKKEFIQSLYIARGSLYETITMLQIFKKKNWLKQDSYERLYAEAEEINKMLSGLINSI